MSDAELVAHTATKLRDSIHLLIHTQTHWIGKVAVADSLYQRMRQALTAASTPSGAAVQASKAPARIDVLAWFCDIDTTVARWHTGSDTINRLTNIYDVAWAPEQLDHVKAMLRRCEAWVASAQEMLGDNPVEVPLCRPCPRCSELWCYRGTGREQTRHFALWGVLIDDGEVRPNVFCKACKTKWTSKQEMSVFNKMLGLDGTPNMSEYTNIL